VRYLDQAVSLGGYGDPRTFTVKQQVGAGAGNRDGSATYRFLILQRPVSHAVQLTRQRAPLPQQILGWSVVVGIFLAALACWGFVILLGFAVYRHF
jgi:hypothetical protein